MTIKCPQNLTAIHKRKPNQFAMPVFRTSTGKILSALEGYDIYQQVQLMNDRDDIAQEVAWQREAEEITRSEYVYIMKNLNELAHNYRAHLDADGHWMDVVLTTLSTI